MYGLLVPAGVDAAAAELLERFADYAPDGSGRVAEALGYVKDDIAAATGLRGFLEDDPDLTDAQIGKILTKVEKIIIAVAQMFEDDDSPMAGALSDFLRDEMGPKATNGAMTRPEQRRAFDSIEAERHRQIVPKQPKRYATKVLQGPW